MDAVVQLDDVTVIYGKNQALKNVTARFAKGAVGLLGPNGAGKSTMLKALLGFVKPDKGRMSVLDLDVAQALVHDPDLLFLDEPTNGMDPKGREEMLELVRDLGHNKGVSLILSSHLLPDVEYTCDHVVVMDKGQVATQGPINELKGPQGRVYELRIKGDLRGFLDVLAKAGMDVHATDEDVMRVFVPAGSGDHTAIFKLAHEFGVQVRHLRPSVPTLEDVFAKAIGEE